MSPQVVLGIFRNKDRFEGPALILGQEDPFPGLRDLLEEEFLFALHSLKLALALQVLNPIATGKAVNFGIDCR